MSGGRVKDALPWVGVYGQFPQNNARAGVVITLEAPINQCFLRSLDGHALKPETQAMRDIVASIAWLSKGVPVGEKVEGSGIKDKSDPVAGKSLYSAKCAACHGTNGEGKSDSSGKELYAVLWGRQSFNDGAGMTRLHMAEAFIKSNMPFGSGGTLRDKETGDIAA